MIDYKKCLEFCLEHEIDQDELFLMYGLYIRDQQLMPEIYGKMREYYSNNKDNRYVDKVLKLEEKGLIEILKPLENKNSVDIRYLKITNEFEKLLFVTNKDEIFQKVYEMYPAKGVSPDGFSYFTANLIKSGNKEYFEKEVLKGMNKFDVDEMLYHISEMFDVDARGKAQNFAKVGFDTFIHNIHEIIRQWKEEQNSNNYGSYNNRLL